MTKEFEQALNEALENSHGSGIYAHGLGLAIDELANPVSKYPAHDRFLEVCNLVDLAFPAGDPKPHELQTNPVTPLLAGFALRALRSYRVQVAGKKTNSATRRAALAGAFSTEGGHGGNTRSQHWNETKQREILHTFTVTFDDRRRLRDSDRHAWELAFAAACEEAFSTDTKDVRDSKASKQTRKMVEILLAEHGYKRELFKLT